MLNKLHTLIDEIVGDLVACWNFANYIYKDPPIDKRIVGIVVGFIFLAPIFINPDPEILLLVYIKLILVSLITFVFLTNSNTFWFLIKKTWMYKVHIKKRSTIKYYLKNIKNLKINDSEKENPEGAIYVISYNEFGGFKSHVFRNGIEAGILLVILFYFYPTFFVFNLLLFGMLFFYVMFFDNQSSSQVFDDIKNLVFCVHKLYKDNPENCRKFIFESNMESVRDLGAIYRALKNSDT